MLPIKIKNTIKQLVKQGDHVVIGVSGGADSVCLLMCFLEIRKKLGISLTAVHINHGIRGEEADADEAFVLALCSQHGVPCKVFKADIPALAAEWKISIEEAGRAYRYAKFYEVCDEIKIQRTPITLDSCVLIAVAHHMDDQAETVLHNMLRGSSLKGLGGMTYKNDRIIRPLLDMRRSEIERYLASIGQEYRTDSTNASTDYTRNKIRSQLIPYMESEINTGAVKHLAALALDAQEADEYISEQAEAFLEECKMAEALDGAAALGTGSIFIAPLSYKIPADKLAALSPALAKKAVFIAISRVARQAKDITAAHVGSVLRLCNMQVDSRVDLPYEVKAERTYEDILIYKALSQEDYEKAWRIASKWALVALNNALKNANIFDYNGQEIPQKQYTKWFDYDKIKGKLFWRHRGEADFIALAGVGNKSINRYMIDEKIPKAARDALPLLTDGDHVLWILGHRISEDYKVTPQTKKIIEISTESIYTL